MAGLKTYREKRRFGVTKEPRGGARAKRGHAFVIQKHDATRLHYDLRLELGGVMKSWAVTRGPSLVPGEKRLAVQVEDHPIEYNKFEGTIPEGEYGGGTVMIWDRGSWTPEGDPDRGLAKGRLSFELDGKKLHGGWHLVRMHRRPGEKRDNWLLIKQKDAAARAPRDKDILEQKKRSVVTGRSLDEIARGAPRKKRKGTKTAKKKTARGKKKKSKKRPRLISVWHSNRPKKGDAKPRATLPAFVAPCLATLVEKTPDAAQWIHEIKFDGYRIQARLDHGKVSLLTRKGLNWTDKFPRTAEAIAALPAQTALIDGELVVNDEEGVSSFSLLQQAIKDRQSEKMAYYAFDLLHLDGEDLRERPLSERKAALARLLANDRTGSLRLSESIDESGPALLRHACKLHLEGIVSKDSNAPYRSGRGHDWLKSKCSDRQEFVVTGFVPSTADAHAIGALVLGLYERGKLRYAGRVGTGYTHKAARELFRKLSTISRDKSPFESVPAEERGKNGARWVEPNTVVEVDFHGWTHGDRVRQASFQGVREDKAPREVKREIRTAAAMRKTDKKRSKPALATNKKADRKVGGISLTHPDRVYWEDAGVTKHDLAEFYVGIWKWMKPHIIGRPIALVRCPDGAAKQCFFQKHASAGIAVEHLHLVPEDGDKIISIDDIDGLIALVQGGVLEVHVRGTTNEHREEADRLVFDIDPGPGTDWKDVVDTARDVRARLHQIKLKSFLKTSGGKGLHVVVPIKFAPWEQVKAFCRAVAEAMEADAPDKYISTAAKAKRKGKMFIDYLRNSREATAVAAYSTRARPGAPVSVPITWDELGSLKSANQYTVKNLAQRLSRLRKDPWAGIGGIKQSLPKFR